MFVNCHSYYSLSYGSLDARELLELGQQHGASCLALTDINSTSACLDFIRLSSEFQIRPILGVDFRKGVNQHFVMLAKNNIGFQNINQYLSKFLHCRKGNENMEIPLKAKQLPDTFVIYPFASFEGNTLADNEFLGIRISDIKDRKSTRLNSSHVRISYAVFCLKK